MKLNGKLARVEEQERLLQEKYTNPSVPSIQTAKPAVAALDSHSGGMQLDVPSSTHSGIERELRAKSKKKKKSKKRKRGELVDTERDERPDRCGDDVERDGNEERDCDNGKVTKKKKKGRKEKSDVDSPGMKACAASQDVDQPESSSKTRNREWTEGTETESKEPVNKRSKKSKTDTAEYVCLENKTESKEPVNKRSKKSKTNTVEDVCLENTQEESIDSARAEQTVTDSGAAAGRKTKKKKKNKQQL